MVAIQPLSSSMQGSDVMAEERGLTSLSLIPDPAQHKDPIQRGTLLVLIQTFIY